MLTKNKQPESVIRKMVAKALGEKEIRGIEELSEGMCNVAYRIHFADGSKSILKIASSGGQGLMANEINLMDAEASAMQIMNQYDFVKTAKVQYYDTSLELCDGIWFLMEHLDGENLFFSGKKFTEEERAVIHREIGRIHKQMVQITNASFGLLGDTRRFDSLYDFFHYMMANMLSDFEKADIPMIAEAEEILGLLAMDKPLFEQVNTPSLVHWDMWEGNIFVKENHVSGIIDWERAVWGEPLMDDRFRRHTRNADFLAGFGKTELSAAELRRILWYDFLLYGIMIAEVTHRQYEDKSQLEWVTPLFKKTWEELKNLLPKVTLINTRITTTVW